MPEQLHHAPASFSHSPLTNHVNETQLSFLLAPLLGNCSLNLQRRTPSSLCAVFDMYEGS